MRCAGSASPGLPLLGKALLEAVAPPAVRFHEQPFVRRSANVRANFSSPHFTPPVTKVHCPLMQARRVAMARGDSDGGTDRC